jgi:hypothetical protein
MNLSVQLDSFRTVAVSRPLSNLQASQATPIAVVSMTDTNSDQLQVIIRLDDLSKLYRAILAYWDTLPGGHERAERNDVLDQLSATDARTLKRILRAAGYVKKEAR